MTRSLEQLREALAGLPLEDEALVAVSDLVNKVEVEQQAGVAALASFQSIQKLIEHHYFRRGDPCPLCHRTSLHATTCYAQNSVGWDLLAEHEATQTENENMRVALARHLPTNGAHILKGGRYRSLKDRAYADDTKQ